MLIVLTLNLYNNHQKKKQQKKQIVGWILISTRVLRALSQITDIECHGILGN